MISTIPEEQKLRTEAGQLISKADDAIRKAQEARRTLGIDDAKKSLSEARNAYNALDLRAKKLEEEATPAGAAKTWMEAYGSTLAAAIVLIVIVAAVLLIRSRRAKK